MDAVAVLAPGGDAIRQRGINSVNDGDVGPEIAGGRPTFARLETRAFEDLIGIGDSRGAREWRKEQNEDEEESLHDKN
jgi:hypothetical protein